MVVLGLCLIYGGSGRWLYCLIRLRYGVGKCSVKNGLMCLLIVMLNVLVRCSVVLVFGDLFVWICVSVVCVLVMCLISILILLLLVFWLKKCVFSILVLLNMSRLLGVMYDGNLVKWWLMRCVGLMLWLILSRWFVV